MVFKAGKDALVKNDAIDAFCKAQENCKLVQFEESFHGLLIETDSNRDKAINEIRAFIQNFLATS